MIVYVAIGELFGELARQFLRFLLLDVLPVVEGDDLVRAVLQPLHEVDKRVVYVTALGEDLFIVQPDDIPFL